jgi:phenylacetate-coenzyme A ligase PaaK-like adenylate-forming protein
MTSRDHRKTADQRLRYLVKYAYENVELYRRKYDEAGIKPDDIRSIEDLPKLPLITKKDIVDGYPDNIRSKKLKPKDYFMVGTSGSTGMPVRIFKNKRLLSMDSIGSLFIVKLVESFLSIKLKTKNTMSIFVLAPDSVEGVGYHEKRKLPAFVYRHNRDIDALDSPQEHIEKINSFKPGIIFTYPSVLRNIVTYAHQHHISLYQPDVLMVSGE